MPATRSCDPTGFRLTPSTPIACSWVMESGVWCTESCRKPTSRIGPCSETFLREFVEQYHKSWNVESRLYAGIPSCWTSSSDDEIRLAVLSNKPQAATEQCVDYYLARFAFAAVLGQQADRPPKPDLTGVREIMERLELPAEACCYVGDTGVDMQTARRAACSPWGQRGAFARRRSWWQRAQQLIDHPCELLPLLGSSS